MTAIRLEPTGDGPTFRYGQLRLPSGNAVSLAVLHTDWDALERLLAGLDRIRELHTDSVAGVCPSCYRLADVSDTDDGLVGWPCPTLQAIGYRDGTWSAAEELASWVEDDRRAERRNDR